VFAEKSGPASAVSKGAAKLPSDSTPLGMHVSVWDPAETMTGVAETPGKVKIFTRSEGLVEATDGVLSMQPDYGPPGTMERKVTLRPSAFGCEWLYVVGRCLLSS
jgi:hypothetical protein